MWNVDGWRRALTVAQWDGEEAYWLTRWLEVGLPIGLGALPPTQHSDLNRILSNINRNLKKDAEKVISDEVTKML